MLLRSMEICSSRTSACPTPWATLDTFLKSYGYWSCKTLSKE